TAGIFKPDRSIYSGILPENMNIANTALEWSGKRWAMVMLPLPDNRQARINLLAHELFHRAQSSLRLPVQKAPNNNHLGQKKGRIYLRLELEALKKVVQPSSEKEKHRHLTHALIFREYRHSLYEGSVEEENTLELNEGL